MIDGSSSVKRLVSMGEIRTQWHAYVSKQSPLLFYFGQRKPKDETTVATLDPFLFVRLTIRFNSLRWKEGRKGITGERRKYTFRSLVLVFASKSMLYDILITILLSPSEVDYLEAYAHRGVWIQTMSDRYKVACHSCIFCINPGVVWWGGLTDLGW